MKRILPLWFKNWNPQTNVAIHATGMRQEEVEGLLEAMKGVVTNKR